MPKPRAMYRLFHTATRRYIAWPGGRGYLQGLAVKLHTEAFQMLRVENFMWGGTNETPVLEVHTVNSGRIVHRHSMSELDAWSRTLRAKRLT